MLPSPNLRNISMCGATEGPCSDLNQAVAKTWCQKSAIFSRSGEAELTIQ